MSALASSRGGIDGGYAGYDGGYAGSDGGRGDRRYGGGNTGYAGQRGGREPGRYGGGYAGYDGGGAGQRRYVPPAGGGGYGAYDTGDRRGTGFDAYEDCKRRAGGRAACAGARGTLGADAQRAGRTRVGCEAALEERVWITDLVNRRLRKNSTGASTRQTTCCGCSRGATGSPCRTTRQRRADGPSFVYAYRLIATAGGGGGQL